MALKLAIENLGVEFGSRKVLNDISFSVNAGELVCVTGRNAAGKTTLLKAIAGLAPRVGNVNLEEDGKVLPKSAIAYLPQLTQVSSRLSVFEMVMLGLGRRLSWRVTPDVFEQVDQTLHAMQISRLADLPVESLSGGWGFGRLSGGRRSRAPRSRRFARRGSLKKRSLEPARPGSGAQRLVPGSEARRTAFLRRRQSLSVPLGRSLRAAS